MSIATYEITPELAQELRAAVAWWQKPRPTRPDRTVGAA